GAGRFVPGQRVALEHALVGCEAGRRLAPRTLVHRHLHAADERTDERLHHPVENGEYLVRPAVEFFDPDVVAALGIDQLHADTDALAHASDAAADQEAHVQIAGDLLPIDRDAAVAERGRAGPHREQPPTRQL